MIKNVKYKEPANYFPEDLMKELMEDGKKNIEKEEKENLSNKPLVDLYNMLETGDVIDKFNAICELVLRKDTSKETERYLRKAKEDKETFWNTYLIADIATAALDMLGIEEYKGDRFETKRMIKSRLEF